ncbi:acyltransferase [Allorhizobium sp. BGMRC 0089]|uniref:acyltransferase family protein n=1 Tax=Allorhizobium sonneratiae TaxID=2934936 RepID=UPI002033802F|nr:acyltransferase [Allorhizobium sonneratiae]MCM2292329.1 acyltransferase [Allorhizobium sonneratiae]
MDGLRGVAALGVMAFHSTILGVTLVVHGYLAVDFFFVLSGFVLAHAYRERLQRESSEAILRLRLIRIMPLALFGLALGTGYFLLRRLLEPQSLYSLPDIAAGTILNMMLLPKLWITPAPTDTIFPANTPLWSLSVEMLMNCVWIITATRLRPRHLLAIILVSAAGLCLLAELYGTADMGAILPTYAGGVLRAAFGFFAGVLLWMYKPEPKGGKIYAVLCVISLTAIMLLPGTGPLPDLLIIICVWPAIVFLAARCDWPAIRPLCNLLGTLSYPLYVIHVPVMMFCVGLVKLLKLDSPVLVMVAAWAISILLAFAADRFYDRPVRAWLRGRFARSTASLTPDLN